VVLRAALFYGVRFGFDLPRSEGNQQQDGGAADAISEGQERKVKMSKLEIVYLPLFD
jgi:hypothetical protein